MNFDQLKEHLNKIEETIKETDFLVIAAPEKIKFSKDPRRFLLSFIRCYNYRYHTLNYNCTKVDTLKKKHRSLYDLYRIMRSYMYISLYDFIMICCDALQNEEIATLFCGHIMHITLFKIGSRGYPNTWAIYKDVNIPNGGSTDPFIQLTIADLYNIWKNKK